MTIFTSSSPLVWGSLDVPLMGIMKDWHGVALDSPAAFSLAQDDQHLWFLAHHQSPAALHPESRPGEYQAGLWKHDCAELFVADPASGRYLEFNLAPNSAWWCAEFTAARVRANDQDVAMPGVETYADLAPEGGWLAAMSIPLDQLRERLGFGPESRVNVTMILESPRQRFLSVDALGDGDPDFHRPGKFGAIDFVPLAK